MNTSNNLYCRQTLLNSVQNLPIKKCIYGSNSFETKAQTTINYE